ncbi:hypothetical protein [Paenibacillus crassostreae]|uniref:hypothetical protein n=1 Tax=Paenibacillus crassostreae TaxID=1763538 RepID=UPI003002ACFC
MKLIQECGERGLNTRISFDLSHIGLAVDSELAFQNLLEMAKEAHDNGLSLMISAEESNKTEQVLSVYKRAVARYTNIGLLFRLNCIGRLMILGNYLTTPVRFVL